MSEPILPSPVSRNFLSSATRRCLGLAQAVGYYLLLVTGTPLVAMVVMTFVGYMSYSDRPGPGWYGLRLGISARELWFFVGWWAFTTLTAIPAAAVLYAFCAALRAMRAPRWLLAALCGLVSLFVSMYLFLAAGWYIALSIEPVAVAGLAGLVYGLVLLPRLPVPLTDSSGNFLARGVFVGGALPVMVVAFAVLVLVIPSPLPTMAAGRVVIGCSLDRQELSEERGGLRPSESDKLRQLGIEGSIGVVAIITPFVQDAAASGNLQQRKHDEPRTVIVVPRFPEMPLDLSVAFTTAGLYVRRDMGWTTIPNIPAIAKRVRIEPIRDAPGNVTIQIEDVSMGSSFHYCR